MLKRVLDGLLKKNKNRQNFKIGTTDGYYYQIEVDRLVNLPQLSYSFTEAILAHTQKHNVFEYQQLANFLKQVASEGFTPFNIQRYFMKNFAFEPWVTLNTAHGRIVEGSFDAKKDKFFLKKPHGLFKYQYLFSTASLLYYSAHYMNENQMAKLVIKINHNLDNNPYLLVKTG